MYYLSLYTIIDNASRLENSDFESRGIVLSKALISFVVTAQLICAFNFAFAKSRVSHDTALLSTHEIESLCMVSRARMEKICFCICSW